MRLVGGQGSVLTVTLGWRENVRREPLRWIVSLQSPLFARVRIEEKNDRVKALHYSFAGSQDLQQMLSAPLQPVRYQLLLTALAEAEALRVQSRYLDYVLADPKLVFVSDGGVPCFAYVPIDNQRVVATMGFGRLLHALTDKKIRFQDPKDAAQRDLLAGFVASMGDEPDFAQFAAFLRDKMGYPLQATTRAVLEDLGLREAERARAREVGEADSPPLQANARGAALSKRAPMTPSCLTSLAGMIVTSPMVPTALSRRLLRWFPLPFCVCRRETCSPCRPKAALWGVGQLVPCASSVIPRLGASTPCSVATKRASW